MDITAEIRQLPLKLCYAITIHKSQGMTLERAFLDLQGCFSVHQAYVGLSRVKSLEGLSLESVVSYRDVRTDAQVIRFYENMNQII
jgi:ATP-dependent exoDNAse (exonuclease V) alpha subunit